MFQYKIEYIENLANYDRRELDELLASDPIKSKKWHILDIITYIHVKRNASACLIRNDEGKIVGGAAFYCKNISTPNATSSLYNLFSLQPGAGSVAFQYYWDWSIEKGARWYKFYVDFGAYEFYKKYGVKYFGASKTGETLTSMGLIYSNDIRSSMQKWQQEIQNMSYGDRAYFEKNYKIFQEKHLLGARKVKKIFRYCLDEAIMPYEVRRAELSFD